MNSKQFLEVFDDRQKKGANSVSTWKKSLLSISNLNAYIGYVIRIK